MLEEYGGDYLGPREAAVGRWTAELLIWRGTRAEIGAAVGSLALQLADGAQPRLADLAYTLSLAATATAPAAGGTLALTAESLQQLPGQLAVAQELLAGDATRVHAPHGIHFSERPLAAERPLAFLFPGQGSQTVDMARELAIAFPEAREAFELADRLLASAYARPLSRFVFPPPSFTREEEAARHAELTDTHVAQTALGATEIAYLRVLAALGVDPGMTAGHSYGEFAALAAAGALTEEQLLALSEARGRFMAQAAAGEAGAMAALDAPADELESLLAQAGVVAANLNAPRQTVISGPLERVEQAVSLCRERDIRAQLLPVACAFHSPHVAGARDQLAEVLSATAIASPAIPVYSNTTGDAHPADPAAIAAVLADHLIQPVQFVREIEAMYRDGARVFLEVGPRSVLSGLVGKILGEREHFAVAVDRGGRGLPALLNCLAALAAEGVPVLPARLFEGRPVRRLELARLPREADAANDSGWLLDGGSARPAGVPAAKAAPIDLPPTTATAADSHPDPEEQRQVPASTSNGHGELAPIAPQQHPTAPALPAGPPLAPPPGPDRVADVMARYHDVMQQFLQTQQAVMLGYLGGARQAPGIWAPASEQLAPPAPLAAPPAIAPPTPVAPQTVAPAPFVAAPAPPPAAGPAPPSLAPALTREQITEQLLSVVSERTGYPPDMLGLDADLEGDLGIDSIKRVEIAGTLTQGLAEDQRTSIDMEQLTASRTLREVIDTLDHALASGAPPGAPPVSSAGPEAASLQIAVAAEDPRPFEHGPAEEERIGRFVVQAASAPAITQTKPLAATGAVVIIDDGAGTGEALEHALVQLDHTVARIPAGAAPTTPEEAALLAAGVRQAAGSIKALVHLGMLAPSASGPGLAALHLLAQSLREDLAAAGRGAVLGATLMGGRFGFDAAGAAAQTAISGAIPGYLKALALEWPKVRVKAVDLGPCSPRTAAQHLLAELTAADGIVEVGYDGTGARLVPALMPATLSGRAEPPEEPIDGDCVLLVTGGARGITADVAHSLAERYRPRLILVGRTPLSDEEDSETASARDPAELRRVMIERRRRAGAELTVALVERDCARVLNGRELRANLERIGATGASVEYISCDVGDATAFAALLDRVYETYGRLDGVIHGAGVIEDKLVADKQLDSLERVLTTKAGAALKLAAKLRPERLRFLVLFSSVSGRFGNRGQADYAAASEVLGKLAHQLDREWPGRVVAIDWGPWCARGMVSPALEQEFARRGVALIPVAEGCRRLLEELRAGRKGEAEVVIGAATGLAVADFGHDGAPAPSGGSPAVQSDDAATLPLLVGCAPTPGSSGGGIELTRALTLARDRYLDDHRVDGRPVLPFAVAMELMAETATLAAPGAAVTALREIRLLNGVWVSEHSDGTTVRLTADPDHGAREVRVAIEAIDSPRAHYRARVDLSPQPPAPPDAAPASLPTLKPFPMPVADAYRELLFHGPLFHGISAIAGLDERGASSLLRASRAGDCVAGIDGMGWLLDPVLLDSALQVQVLWARLQWDVTLLPAEISAYQRSAAPPPAGELVRHELRLRPAAEPPLCRCDHWFYSSDGRLLATLTDVVGVGSQALNRLAGAGA